MPTQAEISLNPTSASGDILSHNGTSRIRVAAGTAAQILVARSSATAGISWETPPSSSSNYEMVVSSTLTADASLIEILFPTGRGTTYKHFLLIATTYKSTDDQYQSGAGFILLNNGTTGTSQSFVQLNTYGGGASDKMSDSGSFFSSHENGFSESDALSSIEMEIFGEGPNVMLLHKNYNGRTTNGDPVFTLVNQQGTSLSSLSSVSLWTGGVSYTYKTGTKVYLYGLKAYGA